MENDWSIRISTKAYVFYSDRIHGNLQPEDYGRQGQNNITHKTMCSHKGIYNNKTGLEPAGGSKNK